MWNSFCENGKAGFVVLMAVWIVSCVVEWSGVNDDKFKNLAGYIVMRDNVLEMVLWMMSLWYVIGEDLFNWGTFLRGERKIVILLLSWYCLRSKVFGIQKKKRRYCNGRINYDFFMIKQNCREVSLEQILRWISSTWIFALKRLYKDNWFLVMSGKCHPEEKKWEKSSINGIEEEVPLGK